METMIQVLIDLITLFSKYLVKNCTPGVYHARSKTVDEDQAKGIIDYTKKDNPVETVYKIFKVFAVDPSIASATL